MYWPLGAPRIYAATKPKRKRAKQEGTDGALDAANNENASALLGHRVSRSGQMFATISATTLTIWQTSPAVALASVTRSPQQLRQYGLNVVVLLRPDASIAVVQTSLGFLVTYSIMIDPEARVFQQQLRQGITRRQSTGGRFQHEEERVGFREVNLRFRMVIRVDAGISKALALDEELVVATEKPAAVQCIRWSPDSTGSQTSTELLSRMPWISKKTGVANMIYDRAMSLNVWITSDGGAYAVQRLSSMPKEPDAPKRLFRGYGFHTPSNDGESATVAAINARFSLLAVGCSNGEILVYTARDYVGSIPLSHKLQPPASVSTTGNITSLNYSPDGYCLFAGYERGWTIWSAYGKPGGSSFTSDRTTSEINGEGWLAGILDVSWLNGGLELLITGQNDDRIWILDMARSAVTGCYSTANISRTLLQSSSSLMVYRGYDLPDLTTITADSSLWLHVQIPAAYLSNQRPVRSTVISPDGRYVAVAGRRGLAHYSVNSGRWKTFDDLIAEDAFAVRGGMCWYQHVLIAAVETDEHHELRLYSRERSLSDTSLVHVERLASPIVLISPTGEDSLLVYTYENILYHYLITASADAVNLVQVGQIAFHGIVRAPLRVRAMSWILPDHQLYDGDPSQDVKHASVIFLVDAKLVLLQPSTSEDGGLKYDMRIIANCVEYYALMRDQNPLIRSSRSPIAGSPLHESPVDDLQHSQPLKDSLWFFDGDRMQCWTDVQDVIRSAAMGLGRDLPSLVSISTDFYPKSILLSKGIVLGVETELVQRRDAHFAFFRFATRTQLYLPPILGHHLSQFGSSAALSLSHQYQHLSYFPHALEILLHSILDEEVDKEPRAEEALLPTVLSFLSSFPEYLDILVQCTRKTEVRSWRTLFAHLPPPQELFEESLQKGLLKTAGGYLLVLHTFEELDSSSDQAVRLLRQAKQAQDWELCKELARFLMALDHSGNTLQEALEKMEISSPRQTRPDLVAPTNGVQGQESSRSRSQSPRSPGATEEDRDYFSQRVH